LIQRSGLKCRVCPFETVIEGQYDEVMELVKDIHDAVYAGGAEEMIVNIKLQSINNQDVFIEDKMGKYE
jgi:uncharacterized protein YqgV (UPF0045/DUF77 family)